MTVQTSIDRDALAVYVADIADLAEKWVDLCSILGLDARETTVSDLLNATGDADDEPGVESSSSDRVYLTDDMTVPDVFTEGMGHA